MCEVRSGRWDDSEIEFLRSNYHEFSSVWIGEKLNRKPRSVTRKANSIGLYKGYSKHTDDLTGKRFGKWTVLKRSCKKTSSSNTMWLCKCECGNVSSVQRPSLVYGTSTKCTECSRKIRHYKNIPRAYFSSIKKRAKRDDKPFDITIEYADELYTAQGGRCILCGVKIGFYDCKEDGKSRSFNKHTASLDRIDSYGGYVIGNVQWVHKNINVMKNTLENSLFICFCHLVSMHTPMPDKNMSEIIDESHDVRFFTKQSYK